jgi:hypothetical protein
MRGVQQLAHRDLDAVSRLLYVLKVLLEEVHADPPGGAGELALGQIADEVVNGIACRRGRLRSWHA